MVLMTDCTMEYSRLSLSVFLKVVTHVFLANKASVFLHSEDVELNFEIHFFFVLDRQHSCLVIFYNLVMTSKLTNSFLPYGVIFLKMISVMALINLTNSPQKEKTSRVTVLIRRRRITA